MWQSHRSGNSEPKGAQSRAQSIVRAIVQSLPAVVNDALAAVLVACAIWFATLVGLQLVSLRAHTEASQVQRIANENRAFCHKWGIGRGSDNHALCTLDLDRIREAERAGFLEQLANYY